MNANPMSWRTFKPNEDLITFVGAKTGATHNCKTLDELKEKLSKETI